jgi:hypothetical protein
VRFALKRAYRVSARSRGGKLNHRLMGTAMTGYGQIGWRMVAIAAFAGTAALAVMLTRAPVHPSAALSSEVSGPTCPTSGLDAWLGLSAAPAGSAGSTVGTAMQAARGTYYTLEFTNVSHRACSLYGYPEVSVYTDSRAPGSQIDSTAIRDTSVRPEPVMLAPGATAHSVLRVVITGDTKPAGCAQVTADELRVTLPHQGRSAFVPVDIPVCSAKGHPSLSVQAIQARPGVPIMP